MSRTVRSVVIVFAVVLVCAVGAGSAAAQSMSKHACVDAHSRGQDARDQGRVTFARKLFLSCAQASCPVAVQNDCARLADDLSALQPSVSFIARDDSGADLPDTSVYVDGLLVATRLDGKPHEVDPGSHTVRFSHAGRDETVTIVIGSGEKGRAVVARFPAPATPRASGAARVTPRPTTAVRAMTPPPRRTVTVTTRSGGAVALAVVGGFVAAAGAGVILYGTSQIPAECDLATNRCAAPAGDPVFERARRGAEKVNIGIAVGSAGAAALLGGLVWYATSSTTRTEQREQRAVAPWVSGDGAGLAFGGRF